MRCREPAATQLARQIPAVPTQTVNEPKERIRELGQSRHLRRPVVHLHVDVDVVVGIPRCFELLIPQTLQVRRQRSRTRGGEHRVDEGDGVLDDDNLEPVVLTGTGVQGDARYKLEVTVVRDISPLTCLEVSLHAGNDLAFVGATVNGNQIISANNRVEASGMCIIHPDAEAVNGFSGTITPGATTSGITPRTMPDPENVFEHYKLYGTEIPLAALPTTGGVATIGRVLLSPADNPFGAVNPQGVYVVDCQSQQLLIHDSRIVGTLVLLNAGPGTAVLGSMNWESAVPDYPALLVGGSLELIIGSAELSEADVGVNLNPPTTPFESLFDADLTDTYPSVIKGLIYVSGDVASDTESLPFEYTVPVDVSIDGALVVGRTLNSFTGVMSLTYRATYLNNPPPGFYMMGGMMVSPGSWRQVVD